ncbi:MAG: class I SAM-dependent methyltransferase [Candidatus Odinarchaeota archaeon]
MAEWTLVDWFLFALIGLVVLFILFQAVVRIVRYYYQFPVPAFMIKIIDNPVRRRFLQKPSTVAERLKLEPGMTVLEIGPGKGSYTKVIAEKVMPGGKVFAIDIQESVIHKLQKKITRENIPNIVVKVDDAYNLSFEDESMDRIFALTCLPEIPDRVKALKEFKRVIKPDGIISFGEIIIDPDYPRRRTEKKWAQEAGLVLSEEFGNVFVYQLNFVKK